MLKLWRIAAHEISFYLKQWTFYLSALGIPLAFAALGAIPQISNAAQQTPLASVETIFSAGSKDFTEATGYIDYADVIHFVPEAQQAFFKAYPDEATAQADLEAGKIESYYLIPATYLENNEVIQYTLNTKLFSETDAAFNQVIRENLLVDLNNPVLVERLMDPVTMIREGPAPQIINFIPPDMDWGRLATAVVVVGLFGFTITLGGNLILRALQREVQSRVLEMLMTSTTVTQFIGGKLLGLSLLAMSQTGLALLAGILVYGQGNNQLEAAEQLSISGQFNLAALPVKELLFSLPYLFFGYLAYCGIMMIVATIWPNSRENAASLIVLRLLMFSPVIGAAFIIPNPDETISIILTTFPLTAPLLMPLRLLMFQVPWWQWIIGLVGGTLWACFTILLSLRIFRANALLTGRTITLSALWQALRG